MSLRDLDIGPLDVLALADAADAPQRAELESRLLLAANPPAGARTRSPSPTAPPACPPGSITFPDLLTAARAVRALLGSARPLDLAAFALPDKAPATGSVDLGRARRAGSSAWSTGSTPTSPRCRPRCRAAPRRPAPGRVPPWSTR